MRYFIFGLFCAGFLTSNVSYSKELLDTKETLLAPQQSLSTSTKSIKEKNAESGVSVLTLENAIIKALSESPRLKASNSGVAAAKGELHQSTAWVNPEIGVQAENVAGKGTYKGFDSAEVTYGVTQEITIGGKISARENIAGKGLEIASLDEQATMLDVICDVTTAYTEAVAAEENVYLATEQKGLAEDVLKSVSVRVGAAAAPLIQKSRAEVERSTATIALDTAMREREITRKKLATLLGDEKLMFALDRNAFYAATKPDIVDIEEKIKNNPSLMKLNTSLEQSKARLDLEEANTIPDPRLSVGVRDFRNNGEQAFVVGVSLPIPVFNANRGNIEKVRNEISRTEFENRNATLTINADLVRAEQQMGNAYLRAETLKHEVLPSADKAFRLSREGYNAGRFPYLEVLDAQRGLFVVKQQHITALKEFYISKAQVERLSAMHLPKIQNKGAINAE